MEKATQGFFGGLRKAILPTDAEKAAKAQYLADTKPLQVAPSAAPAQGISGYVGNSALDARMKAAGMKAGGAVKKCVTGGKINGPGGPTDDLVPIMASNGEFMIKASSAKILGEDVLEALNDLGDEPKNPKDDANEDAEEGEMRRGGAVRKPVLRMFDGGSVDEELNKRLAQIPGSGTAPAPDGLVNGNDFTRNVNTSLNALGGMGVVASVPLKAAAAVPAGLGAIQSSVRAAPMIANSMPGANFIAGANSVRQVGGANLPAVINSGSPVAKTVNVALQEGAKANQMAAGVRSFGNASAGAGMLDGKQQPLEQVPKTQGATPAQPATAAQAPSLNAPWWSPEYARAANTSDLGGLELERARRAQSNPADANDPLKNLLLNGAIGAPGQPANPAVASPQPAAQFSNQGYRGKGYQDPRDLRTPSGAAISELGNEFSNAATLARNPGGAVRKITDANGKVTGYSGGNVTGDVSMVDGNGAPLRGNTRGISSMDTSAGYAADLKQLAEIQKGKDEQNANMQAQADFHANKALEEKALRGNPAALALLKSRMASSDTAKADQTTRRAQDLNAGAVRQTQKLAQDKFGLEATGTKMDNQQKANLMAIQKAMFDPAATPEKRAEATKQFMALNGKSQEAQRPFAVTGGQAVIDGQAVTQPSMVFDPSTKQFINPNQSSQQAAQPPREVGKVYKDAAGNRAKWDGKNFVPV